jgi:diguanylate cyclase (GGDEF)-like protein/PAS domain S-box-containing protein
MDIIWTMDLNLRFTYISPSVERMRGYTVQEAISQKMEEVFTPNSFKVAMKSFEKQLAEEKMKTKDLFKSWTLELEQMCKDSSTMWTETRMTFMRNSDGSPIGILGVTRDITETVQMREKLYALSLHDELTGLYNRRGFLNLAQQQIRIADRTKSDKIKIMDKILLLFIDLDDLKQINDKLGHNEGDRALIDTAKILKKTFRESDIIARFGGDEFAILALNSSEDKILFERLQKNIDAYNALGNSSYTLSISTGVAIYNPENPCTLDKLISRADTLMYEHKKSKKNL